MTFKPVSTPHTLRQTTALADANLDLDAQIEATEQRLVAREAWLKASGEALTHRAQVALTPKRWVLPAVGAGVVLWLGWRLLRRQRSPRPVQHVPVDHHTTLRFNTDAKETPVAVKPTAEKIADLPWAGLTAMAWPLAPAAWRERLSPAAAVTVVSTALSIGRRLFQRRVH